jgi:hypothetical protein
MIEYMFWFVKRFQDDILKMVLDIISGVLRAFHDSGAALEDMGVDHGGSSTGNKSAMAALSLSIWLLTSSASPSATAAWSNSKTTRSPFATALPLPARSSYAHSPQKNSSIAFSSTFYPEASSRSAISASLAPLSACYWLPFFCFSYLTVIPPSQSNSAHLLQP